MLTETMMDASFLQTVLVKHLTPQGRDDAVAELRALAGDYPDISAKYFRTMADVIDEYEDEDTPDAGGS